jgi:SNF2 family DNA or RNA helicase
LDGSTPANDRKEIVDRFQKDDKIKLFIGQIQAAGIGITLTAANACAFAEFGYSPFDHEQAEDRINRIGQNADSITAYYLLNEDSVEKDIMDLLTMKYDNVSKVLDGKSNDDFFQMNIANEVIKKYRKKLV